MATDSLVPFYPYRKFLKVSLSKNEKLLKLYLKYPKMIYIALIQQGLANSVRVQGMSFQRARNSRVKASGFRDFCGVQGQRCHEVSYMKTPKQKLYVLTVSPYTRDFAI